MKTQSTFLTMFKLHGMLLSLVTVALLSTFLIGCDLVNPTNVRNPQITEKYVLGQPGSMRGVLQGVRTSFSSAIENTAYFTDVVSDNYDNWETFISPIADFPSSIRSDDLTLNGVTGMYFEIQEMRALATLGIDVIGPADPTPTVIPAMIVEVTFYRGFGALLLAENFSYVPIDPGGSPLPASQLLTMAVTDLTTALNDAATPIGIRNAAQFALARAYRLQGNKANAATAAAAALAINPEYVFYASFDAQTNTNVAWTFAVARGLNDIQPLPRLDFLDPKYTDPNGITPIPALKAEEMYLIEAEIAISDNNLLAARDRMKDAIALASGSANGRASLTFTDNDPRSRQAGAQTRPNADTVTVKADSTAPVRAGLVKRRSGSTITVRPVSGTSITDLDVDALNPLSVEEHLWMLYLLRQEIFFLEGRRMSDLGIRLPMTTREIESNPSINPGDPGTTITVPSYIPASDQLDRYAVSSGVVTINYDMNLVLATNKVSPFTIP